MKGRNKRRKIRPIRRKPKMSPVRKEFYKRLLYSVGCLGILFLLMDEDGVGAFIALTFFLIAMLQLVYLAILAQEVIDDFFPIKQMHQGKKTRLSKGIYYVACAVFLGSAVTQVFAVKIIDNTIFGSNLFWKAGFIGLLLGIVSLVALNRYIPVVFYESEHRYSILFSVLLGSFFLISAIAGLTNKIFADPTESCQNYTITSKSKNATYDTPYIFIEMNGSKERFEINSDLYNQLEVKGKVQLCIVDGFWGYKAVTSFEVASL